MVISQLRRFVGWLAEPAPDNRRFTIVDRINVALSRVCMLLIVIVVLITFYEVVVRYLFDSPTLWVNEMTLWLGSMIFLISGMYTMQRRRHIRITAVYDIVPRKVQIFFDIVSTTVIVAYTVLMLIGSFHIALEALLTWERFGTYWNPPIPATVKPLVLLTTTLVAVQAINNLIVDTFGSTADPDTTQ